jgi:hypothetical protein
MPPPWLSTIPGRATAQAGSLADGLGGEEGLEDAGAQLVRDSRPRVGDLQQDPRAELLGSRSDGEASRGLTRVHRLVGIGDQVHHHLMELVGVRPEHGQVVGQVDRTSTLSTRRG